MNQACVLFVLFRVIRGSLFVRKETRSINISPLRGEELALHFELEFANEKFEMIYGKWFFVLPTAHCPLPTAHCSLLPRALLFPQHQVLEEVVMAGETCDAKSRQAVAKTSLENKAAEKA